MSWDIQLFPKLKSPLISDHWWDSGKYDGAADGDWENCVRSQGAYFEGDWGIIVLCTMFLVSCISFNKCLYFSCYMAGYFLERPCRSPAVRPEPASQVHYCFSPCLTKPPSTSSPPSFSFPSPPLSPSPHKRSGWIRVLFTHSWPLPLPVYTQFIPSF